MKHFQKYLIPALSGILLSVLFFVSTAVAANEKTPGYSLDSIPEYTGAVSVPLNDNVPSFSEKMIADARDKVYESYASLDSLGRCGVCTASLDQSLMPTEARGDIGQIKPSGWQTIKYPEQIDDNYLYNRCHLIGYQLTAENANKKNLITGTRYLNVDGMLPYENLVADYLKQDSSHRVLYRVTPLYAQANDLLCSGVQMEALSLDDNGQAIQFNVYCYNVQPGIVIDYTNGASALDPNWEELLAAASGSSIKTSPETTPDSSEGSNASSLTPAESELSQSSFPATGSSATAWLSATGSKYHSIDHCGRMNPNKATQTTVEAAEAAGYGRCSKCW